MKQISNKKYEAYQQYQTDMLHGRILTPDGLRVLCASLDNDPEKIGKHMLEMLAKFRSEGLFNVVVEDETDEDLYDYVYNFIGTLEKTWSKDIAKDILIGQFPSYDAKIVYESQGLDGLFNFLGQKFIDRQGTH